jgi:Flp pilus assembly CpaF family ATPase
MSMMLRDGSSLFVSSSFLFAFLASFLSFLLCGGETSGATT